MKNTFRYSLDFSDFVKYEKFCFKKYVLPQSIMTLIMIAAIVIYSGAAQKNIYVTIFGLLAAAAFAAGIYFKYTAGIRKKVKKYTVKDSLCFNENEITVNDNSIEIKNIPDESGVSFMGIYPFSIMTVIYENKDFFCFQIGGDARLLPKSSVPVNMREIVFNQIRSNRNCITVK